MNPSSDNLVIGKGIAAFGDPLMDFGEISDFAVSVAIETLPFYSNRGGLKKKVIDPNISVDPTFGFTVHEMSVENIGMYTLGERTQVSQIAQSDGSLEISLKKGAWYDLGYRNLTTVTIPSGTAGVDFIIYATLGMIFIPHSSTLTEGTVTVTFSAEALTYERVKLYKQTQLTGPFMFMADPPIGTSMQGGKLYWPKVSLKPSGDFGLISDEYLTFAMEGSVLSDDANNPDTPYGTFDLPQMTE